MKINTNRCRRPPAVHAREDGLQWSSSTKAQTLSHVPSSTKMHYWHVLHPAKLHIEHRGRARRSHPFTRATPAQERRRPMHTCVNAACPRIRRGPDAASICIFKLSRGALATCIRLISAVHVNVQTRQLGGAAFRAQQVCRGSCGCCAKVLRRDASYPLCGLHRGLRASDLGLATCCSRYLFNSPLLARCIC